MKLLNAITFGLGILVSLQSFAELKYDDARIFAPLKGAVATGGYVTVKNDSKNDVELILKSVEGFKAVETHETVEEAGKMAMKKVDSFKIPAGGTLELKPGGKHLMLFEADDTVREGHSLKVIFSVNKKDETVSFKVVPRMVKSGGQGHH